MAVWENKTDFKSCVLEWAGKLDIVVQSINLRPMSRKWASCSTSGRLNFNNELLSIDKSLGEYVIVHELMHFRVPNHGRLWKSYMNLYLPNWQTLDKKLREVTQKELDF